MDLKYVNSITFSSFEDYRNALGLEDLKAIVIYKDPVNWLESIRKWGFICNWITTDAEFQNVWSKWLKEYSEYYLKWTQFRQDPNLLIIQYEDFVFNFGQKLMEIEIFLNQRLLSKAFPMKVTHSSPRTYSKVLTDIRFSCFPYNLITEIYKSSKFKPRITVYKNYDTNSEAHTSRRYFATTTSLN